MVHNEEQSAILHCLVVGMESFLILHEATTGTTVHRAKREEDDDHRRHGA